MTVSKITIDMLEATKGMILTNGEAYGKKIYLSCNDKPENWHEITETEYKKILGKQESEAE